MFHRGRDTITSVPKSARIEMARSGNKMINEALSTIDNILTRYNTNFMDKVIEQPAPVAQPNQEPQRSTDTIKPQPTPQPAPLLLILGVGCLLMLAFCKLPVLRTLAGSLMGGALVTALLSFLSYPVFGNHLSGGDLAGIIITMSVASLISVGCSKLGMKKTMAGIWSLALFIAFLIVVF